MKPKLKKAFKIIGYIAAVYLMILFLDIVLQGSYDKSMATEQKNETTTQYTIDINKVHESINQERMKLGIEGLNLNPRLNLAAQEKCNDMVSKHYYDHVAPDGTTPGNIVVKYEPHFIHGGENLANGYTDPKQVVAAWMASEGHRKNILNSNFTDEGLAYCNYTENDTPSIYVVEEFTTQPQ